MVIILFVLAPQPEAEFFCLLSLFFHNFSQFLGCRIEKWICRSRPHLFNQSTVGPNLSCLGLVAGSEDALPSSSSFTSRSALFLSLRSTFSISSFLLLDSGSPVFLLPKHMIAGAMNAGEGMCGVRLSLCRQLQEILV